MKERMLRCKNCEHEWDGANDIYEHPYIGLCEHIPVFTKRQIEIMWGCSCVLAPYLRNPGGNCQNYKRKWWKFWADEKGTKKQFIELQKKRDHVIQKSKEYFTQCAKNGPWRNVKSDCTFNVENGGYIYGVEKISLDKIWCKKCKCCYSKCNCAIPEFVLNEEDKEITRGLNDSI